MYLARLTPYQLCNPSNKLHCPEKRLEKLLMGVGVFSRFSAKSARVKFCWRNREPKTNTGSLPRTALSVKVILGSSGARDSRMAAVPMLYISHGGFVQRILFQRHADRLRQSQRSSGLGCGRCPRQGDAHRQQSQLRQRRRSPS